MAGGAEDPQSGFNTIYTYTPLLPTSVSTLLSPMTTLLNISIHCVGCRKKVRKVNIEGVYKNTMTPKTTKLRSRAPGESFLPKPSKDAEMEKILRSMEGMPGAPNMKMYSREDLMNNNFGGEADEEDDDGDDEGDNFPANLGQVLKHKEPSKKDLKQTILQGVADTKAKIKKHIKTTSQKIRKWWKGKRTAGKPPKGSKNEL